jgi:Arc/MetJ family transcription regulator
MRKTTVAVDDELIRQAEAILGTRGITATVDAALREVTRMAARRAAVAELVLRDGIELDDPEIMAGAWR